MNNSISFAIIALLLYIVAGCNKSEHAGTQIPEFSNDSETIIGQGNLLIGQTSGCDCYKNGALLQCTADMPLVNKNKYLTTLYRKLYHLQPEQFKGITFDIWKVENNCDARLIESGDDGIADCWPTRDLLCTITTTNGFEVVDKKDDFDLGMDRGDSIPKHATWTNSRELPSIQVYPQDYDQAPFKKYYGIRHIQKTDTLYGWFQFEICNEEPCVKQICLEN